MDVYCPACGKKGRIDDAKIPANGVFARCPGCSGRLWINKTEGVSLAEEPSTIDHAHGVKTSGDQVPSNSRPVPPPPSQTSSVHQTESSEGMTEQPSPAPSSPPAPDVPSEGSGLTDHGRALQQPAAPAQPAATPTGFEVTPLSANEPLPGREPPPGETIQSYDCNVCGNKFPGSDMVRFGDTMVCADCKPRYVQMMRSGVTRPGSFNYGGFWIRFVAKFIDGIILAIAQGILITPLFIFVFRSPTLGPGTSAFAAFASANILINILSIAVGATYTTLFIGRYGATPGKMTFGLMVVTPDGGRVSYMRALGRHFAEMVSAFTLLIGYIMAGFDSQKRSLHDRICSTRVIRK